MTSFLDLPLITKLVYHKILKTWVRNSVDRRRRSKENLRSVVRHSSRSWYLSTVSPVGFTWSTVGVTLGSPSVVDDEWCTQVVTW